ncbi:MAG: hypothetical protein NVS1B14_03300 [Vulcanimicrobiaceae bacterium]
MSAPLKAVLARARAEGVHVEYADLGTWGEDELRSEYDPDGVVIRVNVRALERVPEANRNDLAALAIAHELYHHRESAGAVARLATRAAREAAAERFAQELCKA